MVLNATRARLSRLVAGFDGHFNRSVSVHVGDGVVLDEPLSSRLAAVIWGYRLFLGREPENDNAVSVASAQTHDWGSVHDHFVGSREYLARYPDRVSPAMTGTEEAMSIETVQDPADLQQLLDHVTGAWTELGKREPHFSVITSEKYLAHNLGDNQDEFWASANADVERLRATVRRAGLSWRTDATCLELGCGVGRISAVLAQEFGVVVGVDISPNHLALARHHLDDCGLANVELLQLTDLGTLEQVDPFDVFFSVIVLQHNPPPVVEAMLNLVFAKLAPGGLAYFQVPTHRVGYSFDLQRYIDGPADEGGIEMHALPQHRILEIARAHGLQLVEVLEDGCTGRRPGELSNTFLFTKP